MTFWRKDADDELDEKLKNPDVTVPEDLIGTDEGIPISKAEVSDLPVSLAQQASLTQFSDDQLIAELALRKARRLDPKIEALKKQLEALERERSGYGIIPPEAAPVAKPVPTTTVNPITGKNGKPPKAGTVPKGLCSCSGAGCYLCLKY